MIDPDDPAVVDALAEAAYMARAAEIMAADREHELDPDASYMVLAWDCLSPETRAPYVAGVRATLAARHEFA